VEGRLEERFNEGGYTVLPAPFLPKIRVRGLKNLMTTSSSGP